MDQFATFLVIFTQISGNLMTSFVSFCILQLMQGHWRAGGLERVFEIYANLPPAFLGGDRAAVACLGHHARGRLDRLSPLLKKMRELDDPPCQVLACELLERLVGGGDWKIALETLELMVDFDLHVTREQARQIATQAKASAEGGALEVMHAYSYICRSICVSWSFCQHYLSTRSSSEVCFWLGVCRCCKV